MKGAPSQPAPEPAMNQRDARIQKWAVIAFALVEAAIIAIVVVTKINHG